MINGLLTLRGAWRKVTTDPILKFYVVGITFYGMATFEGPLLSVKSVNALSHYTDWTIAHVHSGALGWNGFMTFGMIYWLLPRLYQTKLWSTKMAEWHFWIGTIGILLYIVPIYAAGITQGLMWRGLDDLGRLQYPDFIETVQTIVPFWWFRIIGGALFVTGVVMLAVNAVMTWSTRPATYEDPVYTAPRLTTGYLDDSARPSKLAGKPVLEAATKIDQFVAMDWHRRWERLPIRFTLLTAVAVILASLFEFVPMFLIRSNIPTISSVKPYTPLELAGRDVYVSEGCYNCHSQMIRPMVAETQRYGEFSKAGESIYDRPFQWGSRRIGPDLAREGGKQSSFWHWTHFEKPSQISPGTVMPSYQHLLTERLNFGEIEKRVQAAHFLGAPYDKELTEAEAMAHKQSEAVAAEIIAQGGPVTYQEQLIKDSTAIALIAYLQRVGKDLYRVEEPPKTPAPAKTASLLSNEDR